MNSEQLKSLETDANQELTLMVRNGSDSSFSKISLTLRVSSEDTTLARARYYRSEVSTLKSGDSKFVSFPLDLSPLADPGEENHLPENQVRSRIVLEVQATTPEGISTVKTAVLPFSGDRST